MSTFREAFDKKYKKEKWADYNEETDYLFMANAPRDYRVEDEMLEYMNSHPNATVAELYDYFDKIAPEGEPIGDDGLPLYKDDD